MSSKTPKAATATSADPCQLQNYYLHELGPRELEKRGRFCQGWKANVKLSFFTRGGGPKSLIFEPRPTTAPAGGPRRIPPAARASWPRAAATARGDHTQPGGGPSTLVCGLRHRRTKGAPAHLAQVKKNEGPRRRRHLLHRGEAQVEQFVVSEGVRGRGGDREEEAYSASRHLRRTQSGPAAGAGSRAKRDGVGLPSRSVGGPTRGPTRRLFWASILFASVLHAASYSFCCLRKLC